MIEQVFQQEVQVVVHHSVVVFYVAESFEAGRDFDEGLLGLDGSV